MTNKLVLDIKEIINSDKAKKSNKINERLRGETIILPKSYIEEKKIQDECTIDSNKFLPINSYQLEAGMEDMSTLDTIKDGAVLIKGNSFGPYLPNSYFQNDVFKICWLLKEPYIELESYLNGDRGSHNQAAEYVQYYVENGKFGNQTHDNLLVLSQIILRELAKISDDDVKQVSDNSLRIQIRKLKNEKIDDLGDVMSHICILETNHFPGLALKTPDTNEMNHRKWVQYNKELIKVLLDFYNPNVVIGCYTLMGQFASNSHLLNYFGLKEHGETPYLEGKPWDYIENEYKVEKTIFDYPIVRPWGGIDPDISEKHSMVKTANGIYWINAYQPDNRNKKENEANLIKFARDIRKDISETSKFTSYPSLQK